MNISTLDAVPGYNLYIGGFIALRRPQALENCRITHIVSVLDWHFSDDTPLLQGLKHLHIPVDDVEEENLIVWFSRSNAFIEEALNSHLPSRFLSTSSGQDAPDEVGSRPGGPGVLVHCAMGKSRSATIIIAYLLWSSNRAYARKLAQYQTQMAERQARGSTDAASDNEPISIPPKPFDVVEALTLLRRGRSIAEPNEGFMEQLYLYHDMGCPDDIEGHRLYRRWMYRRNVAESLTVNQAPDLGAIQFEDEEDNGDDENPAPTKQDTSRSNGKASLGNNLGVQAPSGTEPPPPTTPPQKQDIQIKCRKCRRLLARRHFIIDHLPSTGGARSINYPPPRPHHLDPYSPDQPDKAGQCAHIFLHPLSWMRPALAEGKLDGRLTCPNPRCGANVGKFAWQGLKCSCGGWVTPGFGVARARVDEMSVPLLGGGGAARAGRADGVSIMPIRDHQTEGGKWEKGKI